MKPWGLVPNPRFEDLANDLLLEKIYKKKKIKPTVMSLSLSLRDFAYNSIGFQTESRQTKSRKKKKEKS